MSALAGGTGGGESVGELLAEEQQAGDEQQRRGRGVGGRWKIQLDDVDMY